MTSAARALASLFSAVMVLGACREDAPAVAVDAAADVPVADVPAANDVSDVPAPDDVSDVPAIDDVTDAAAPGSFGQPCVVRRAGECADGLICLQGPAGGSAGFCTRTCPRTSSGPCTGAPPGTAAFCLVTNANAAGDKACAFVCLVGGMTYVCPGALRCASGEEPAGSGQRLCLP